MCTLKLPKTVIKVIDKYRKDYLWRGSDINKKKGYNLAVWTMVTIPKEKGGLGVKNLYLQNDALLGKQLAKFYNKADVPWVHLIWSTYYNSKVPHLVSPRGSFWWKDLLSLSTAFKGIATCTVGIGNTVSLWDDNYLEQALASKFPMLQTYDKQSTLSLQKGYQEENRIDLFRLPLNRAAYNEFIIFDQIMNDQNLLSDQKDT
jgi:hypothetical protein